MAKTKPVKFYLVSKVFRDVITDGKHRGCIRDLFESSEVVPADNLRSFLLNTFECNLTDNGMKALKKMRDCYLDAHSFGSKTSPRNDSCCFFGDPCVRVQELVPFSG